MIVIHVVIVGVVLCIQAAAVLAELPQDVITLAVFGQVHTLPLLAVGELDDILSIGMGRCDSHATRIRHAAAVAGRAPHAQVTQVQPRVTAKDWASIASELAQPLELNTAEAVAIESVDNAPHLRRESRGCQREG